MTTVTKLEKLARGREMRMLVVSLKARVEGPFNGKTFRSFVQSASRTDVAGWYFAALYAGEEKIYEIHRGYC